MTEQEGKHRIATLANYKAIFIGGLFDPSLLFSYFNMRAECQKFPQHFRIVFTQESSYSDFESFKRKLAAIDPRAENYVRRIPDHSLSYCANFFPPKGIVALFLTNDYLTAKDLLPVSLRGGSLARGMVNGLYIFSASDFKGGGGEKNEEDIQGKPYCSASYFGTAIPPLGPDAFYEISLSGDHPDLPVEGSEFVAVGSRNEGRSKTRMRLIKRLGNPGGEGVVYQTNVNGVVAKILQFNANRPGETIHHSVRRAKFNKMIYMVEHQLTGDPAVLSRIIWPQKIVTYKGTAVGFLMKSVPGPYDLSELFSGINNADILSKTPDLTRTKLVQVCVSILEILNYLNQENILVGDIKLANFKMLREGDFSSVCILDTDSFQIEQYPCGVYTPGYVAPEFLNVRPDEGRMRTREIENFAIAVLLFQILMGIGVSPFNADDFDEEKETEEDRTKRGAFPYRLDNLETRKNLTKNSFAAQIVIWSHFPNFIKEDFINAFQEGARNPFRRPSSYKWLQDMRAYLAAMQDGRLAGIDPDYNKPFYNVFRNKGKIDRMFNAKLLDGVFTTTAIGVGFSIANALNKAALKATKGKPLEGGTIAFLKYAAEKLRNQEEFTSGKWDAKLLQNLGVLVRVQVSL
jgi:serine/threonine protein kinase